MTYVYYKDHQIERWRWVLYLDNGGSIAMSTQTYETERECIDNILRVKQSSGAADIRREPPISNEPAVTTHTDRGTSINVGGDGGTPITGTPITVGGEDPDTPMTVGGEGSHGSGDPW